MKRTDRKRFTLDRLALLLIISLLSFHAFQQAAPGKQTQSAEFKVDWKRASKYQTLSDKYTFLAQEYERIVQQWEKIVIKESARLRISFDLKNLYQLLDSELLMIRLFPFQKWSAENRHPSLKEIIKSEDILKILKEWNKRYLSIMNEERLGNSIKELMAAYLASEGYIKLAEATERANIIFYEGFEEGDLSEWAITGKYGDVSIDSSKKVRGKYSVKISNKEPPFIMCLLKESISYKPTKIGRDWWAWLPAAKDSCRLNLYICGIHCWWRSQRNQHFFIFQGKEMQHKQALAPNRWHRFRVITDFEKGTSDVLVNNRLIFRDIPLFKFRKESELAMDTIQIMGFDYEPNTGWIDEVRIYYLN